RNLHDRERHLGEVEECVVAVDAHSEVGLGDAVQTEVLDDVDQVASLHTVPGEEGQSLEQLTPAGILTSQRLYQPGQHRIEEIDERACRELGNPSTTGGLKLAAEVQRPPVETFDVADPGVDEQRADRAVHELRVDVGDVGIAPDDDVSLQHVEALPQGFALTLERAVARQNLGMLHHGN